MAGVYHTCTVEGCDNPVRRSKSPLCEKHYMRMYRNGTTAYVGSVIPGNRTHSGGYILTPAPGHPRALGEYRAYEHRVVYQNEHGDGPFACHWCGCVVTWSDMHVDHVDANPENNESGNLAASCPPCNQQRGHEKAMRSWRDRRGITIDGVTLTLNEWAARVGISRASIISRMKKGWPIHRAVHEPRGKCGPKSSRPRA